MFAERKLRSGIALISAIILLLSNSVIALAAPVNYKNVDDVKAKALGKYLSSGSVIATGSELVSADKNLLTNDNIKTETVSEELSFKIVKRLNPELEAGVVETIREGESGEKTITYEVT